MSSVLVVGECMLEFRHVEDKMYQQGFAGDTYNTAVYAKRIEPSLQVDYCTAVGQDTSSQQFVQELLAEHIGASHVIQLDKLRMGLYMIHIDAAGERSFSYWRNQSAARSLFKQDINFVELFSQYSAVYLSGISVAILDTADREKLLTYLAEYRKQGGIVVFDPNYRPALWESLAEAQEYYEKFYQLTDIALPGLDDHKDIFGHENQQQVQVYLTSLGVQEQVIKCGLAGMYVYQTNQLACHLPFTPAEVQVDSTAAGDSFAGVYVAKRLKDYSMQEAVVAAADVARFVVGQPGAIVDAEVFKQHCS
ncbi:sugar kinase [Catenovulum sp. SX2]|uniref:sugar kinase n=1 Tax=Catenovulum sp. SX2 TaxID=3398614 RepID=UPI003F838A01